jgi:hypothetical protein
MKIATIIVRTILGLLFLIPLSVTFFTLIQNRLQENLKAFQLGLVASTYLFPLAKSVEFLCGLSFCWKIHNISEPCYLSCNLNILLINYFLTPDNLPWPYLYLLESFLIFAHWKIQGLFKID